MTQREQLIEKMASMAVQEGYAFEMNEIDKEAASWSKSLGRIARNPIQATRAVRGKGGKLLSRSGKPLYGGAYQAKQEMYNDALKTIKEPVIKGLSNVRSHLKNNAVPYAAAGGLAAAGGGAYLALSRKAQGEE
jgi:hypothetical protein